MIENFVAKAMSGLLIIGTPNSPESLANILIGVHDFQLKCALYYTLLKKEAQDTIELENPIVLNALERFKEMNREVVRAIFAEAELQDHAALAQKLRDSNKPHELGTVAEIATKYGISKSEVRRRKAEGTLNQLEAK